MEIKELNHQLTALVKEFSKAEKELKRQYCDANNPYKVGDTFTDHMGSIIVDAIDYNYGSSMGNPCCVYTGRELKKDGTFKKNGSVRYAYQSNDINILTATGDK